MDRIIPGCDDQRGPVGFVADLTASRPIVERIPDPLRFGPARELFHDEPDLSDAEENLGNVGFERWFSEIGSERGEQVIAPFHQLSLEPLEALPAEIDRSGRSEAKIRTLSFQKCLQIVIDRVRRRIRHTGVEQIVRNASHH